MTVVASAQFRVGGRVRRGARRVVDHPGVASTHFPHWGRAKSARSFTAQATLLLLWPAEDLSLPEGDVVWRACRRLHDALAGRVLTRCEFRVPSLATTDLTGVLVEEVVSRGKHQLFRFGDGVTLHSHFRMDGTWRIYPAGRRWSGGPDWQVRAVLGNSDHAAVGYRLPVLELIPTADEDTVVGHLGPDLLGPDWDLDEAVRRLLGRPEIAIGEALLNQRNLAGIGTFYRSEILFLQGIHPRTPVGAVPGLRRLVSRAQHLMYANRVRIEQSSTGDLRPGRNSYVFGRVNQPCRRCGSPIRTDELGPPGMERRSYWCPVCQPPRPDDVTAPAATSHPVSEV